MQDFSSEEGAGLKEGVAESSVESTLSNPSRLSTTRTTSKHIAIILLGAIPTLCFIALLILLVYVSRTQLFWADASFGCDSKGKVWVNTPPTFTNDNTYTFAITMAFGALDYTSAKVIDESWNLIIGRGSQIIGGIIIYKIFRNPLAQALSQRHRPYKTALALQYSTISLDSIWRYMVDILQTLRLTSSTSPQFLSTLLLALSSTCILISPTWLSAMTGYQAKMTPIVPWSNGSFISTRNFSECLAVIIDGDRVGLTKNACVPPRTLLANALNTYLDDLAALHIHKRPETTVSACDADDNEIPGLDLSRYSDWLCTTWPTTSQFTYRGQISSLDAPTLKLQGVIFDSTNVSIKPVLQGGYVFMDSGPLLMSEKIREHGICQPQQEYQWGFSYQLTFAFLVTYLVLSIVLYIYWIILRRQLAVEEVSGSLKTAIVIERQLRGEIGSEVHVMTEKEIDKELKSRRWYTRRTGKVLAAKM